MRTALLEREEQLDVLASVLDSAADGRGGVVLVAGEAGIGKTSLIRAFTARAADRARILHGACDDLVTRRTLGAVRDAFAGHCPAVERILADGTRDDLLVGVLAELAGPAHPTVLVIEDVHWADDATLDVLRYAGRRIDTTTAMLVLSYRDDEIGRDHPAQRLLGGLGGAPVHRLAVPRLSRSAVATLAGGTVATSAPLYTLTGGNPFYVTEVVATGRPGTGAAVPLTVVDAVLARVHQLDPAARTALEQLAVVPSQVELPLARALLGDLGALADAERSGVLEVRPHAVAFRHELARRAVESTLPVSDRIRFNATVLATLTARDEPDLPRIVHHAVEAADDARVVELAPRAAAQAARAGSYAQEITYYRLLVEREHLVDAPAIAEIHRQLALALWAVDEPVASLEHGLAAVRIRERLEDPSALGEAWVSAAPALWTLARTADSLDGFARAVELLGSVPETPARTLAMLWHAIALCMKGEPDLALAEQAAASAGRTGVPELVGFGRTCLGRTRLLLGEPDEGLELMRAGLAATRAAGAHTFAMITHGCLIIDQLNLARFAECRRHLDEAIAYANECEVWFFASSWQALGCCLQAQRGEWDEAIAALTGIAGPDGGPERGATRYALPPLARLLARRGAADAPAVLARVRDFAHRADCYHDWLAADLAETEAAWLTGRPADAREAITRLDRLTDRPGRETERGELHRWKRRLGLPHEVPAGCPDVYAAGIRGDWQEAATAWERIGAPYERALELLDSGEIEPTLRALEILDDLGAASAAHHARARLRALGLSSVPRGPQPATRANPAGLTGRQLEILHLLARGLTNTEIAAHAVLSVRTVDHHVSAVLQKLGAPNRRRAAVVAREVGIEV